MRDRKTVHYSDQPNVNKDDMIQTHPHESIDPRTILRELPSRPFLPTQTNTLFPNQTKASAIVIMCHRILYYQYPSRANNKFPEVSKWPTSPSRIHKEHNHKVLLVQRQPVMRGVGYTTKLETFDRGSTRKPETQAPFKLFLPSQKQIFDIL